MQYYNGDAKKVYPLPVCDNYLEQIVGPGLYTKFSFCTVHYIDNTLRLWNTVSVFMVKRYFRYNILYYIIVYT